MACSSSYTFDGGVPDEGGAADGGWRFDAAGYEVVECGLGRSHYHYISDGVPDTTGCVLARVLWILRDESVGPGRARSQLQLVYASDAASDLSLRGLPPHVCGANIELANIEPEAGRSGDVVGDWNLDGEASAGIVNIGYTTDGSAEPCDARAPAVAGEWRIVEGGMPGDPLEIHATGVVIEPFDGHTLVFPLMVWRAEIAEPVMFP